MLIEPVSVGSSIEGKRFGRYLLFDQIGSGGMAQVHIGRLLGPVGFSRTVAIKRLRSEHLSDHEFVSMFIDEARLAARVQHRNVVQVLDVVASDHELFLVMEYVRGESLSQLIGRPRPSRVPVSIALAIATDMLYGLHAAHEATTEAGEPLHIVHRDVSPQNVLVGSDGVARVADFGVAKATARISSTHDGQLKGKVAYMSPEQIRRRVLDRRSDIFASSVVIWEMLTGERLFGAGDPGGVLHQILYESIPTPSSRVPELPRVLDSIVMKGLSRERDERFATAHEMGSALEALGPARATEVANWVASRVGPKLEARATRILAIEQASSGADHVGAEPAPPRRELPTAPISVSEPVREAPLNEGTSPGTEIQEARASSNRRPRLVLALTTLLLMIGAAIAFVSFRNRADPELASSPDLPATTASEREPKAVASATPARSASELDMPSALPSATTAPVATSKPRTIPTAKPAPKPKAGCNPPYTIDARGIRVYKRECLNR